MSETIDRDGDFTEGADPSNYNVGPVVAFLATASAEETERIAQAEGEGEKRSTVLDAVTDRRTALEADDASDPADETEAPPVNVLDPSDVGFIQQAPREEGADPIGLETTENPNDLSAPYVDPTGSSLDAKVGDQEGAPKELSDGVKYAEAVGFVGVDDLKPAKEDHTQRNPVVMNRG